MFSKFDKKNLNKKNWNAIIWKTGNFYKNFNDFLKNSNYFKHFI